MQLHFPTASLFTAALGLAALAQPALAHPTLVQSSGTATYRLTFDATWSATNHPGAFVSSAHFSPLIGAAHGDGVSLWQPGTLASAGIEQMAETGATSSLTQEVNAAIAAGTALERISGGGIGISPGMASTTFTVTAEFPLASVVTMVAPSPDWFLGVHDLSLLENGDWVDDLTVDLFVYDSGTDSGLNLTSPNQDTNPAEPISLQTTGPFFGPGSGQPALGTFRFERLASTIAYGAGVNPAGSLEVTSGAPTIGSTVDLTLDDPSASMGVPSGTLVAIGTQATVLPVPGFSLSTPGGVGELLVDGALTYVGGPTFSGSPVTLSIPVPNNSSLVGLELFAQGALVDTTLRVGVTEGAALVIGS